MLLSFVMRKFPIHSNKFCYIQESIFPGTFPSFEWFLMNQEGTSSRGKKKNIELFCLSIFLEESLFKHNIDICGLGPNFQ